MWFTTLENDIVLRPTEITELFHLKHPKNCEFLKVEPYLYVNAKIGNFDIVIFQNGMEVRRFLLDFKFNGLNIVPLVHYVEVLGDDTYSITIENHTKDIIKVFGKSRSSVSINRCTST
jgi:hypothetical protein